MAPPSQWGGQGGHRTSGFLLYHHRKKEREMRDEDVSAFIVKMEGMWPILRNNEEHKKAIVLLLNEKAMHVSADDLTSGYRLLVAHSRTSNKDGGPAWPPSPNDVVGCVLMAHRDRRSAVKISYTNRGPRRVAGRVCRKCNGEITFLPGDDVLYCISCRTVQTTDGKARLTPHDVHALEFIEAEEVDYDTAERDRLKAIEAIKRLGIR